MFERSSGKNAARRPRPQSSQKMEAGRVEDANVVAKVNRKENASWMSKSSKK